MNDKKQIVENIRRGVLDINNQELFFATLIKGLLLRLDDDISIRNIAVPHFILHTGDDTMYLNMKGQNNAIEPQEVSNEEYIYNIIPRCIVLPGGIDLVADQLTSPYARGIIQYESNNNIYNFSAEFRRMPIKMNCEIKYYLDSYRDYLELILQVISKLSFIKTYDITYMGLSITCSYKIPEAFEGEYTMELDGTSLDNKCKTVSLSLEIETNYPIYSPRTVISTDDIITNVLIGNPNAVGELKDANGFILDDKLTEKKNEVN